MSKLTFSYFSLSFFVDTWYQKNKDRLKKLRDSQNKGAAAPGPKKSEAKKLEKRSKAKRKQKPGRKAGLAAVVDSSSSSDEDDSEMWELLAMMTSEDIGEVREESGTSSSSRTVH